MVKCKENLVKVLTSIFGIGIIGMQRKLGIGNYNLEVWG